MRRRNRKRHKKAQVARSKADKCITKYCRNQRALKKTTYKKADGTVVVYENFLKRCWKCHSRGLKQRRPWTYVLNMLRHSAYKRNLPFTLTVESFKKWCIETGYLEKRGTKPGDMTVDRIDRNEGYHIWNIQTLTHKENSDQGSDNTPREIAAAEAEAEAPPDPDNEPF